MKRLYILLSVLVVLLFTGFAATYSVPQPQAEPQEETIASRPLSSEEDAIAYAKALWQSDYLLENTNGLAWYAQAENGMYYVTAGGNQGQLYANISNSGNVTYLYNGLAYFDSIPLTGGISEPRQDELTQYLRDFTDALQPGASTHIRSFAARRGTVTDRDNTFGLFMGYADGAQNSEADTYTLFVVQVAPRLRVVNYSVGLPVDSGAD